MGGLRKLVCLMPAETSGHEGWTAETEQPGTSYNSNNSNKSNNNNNSNEGPSFAYRENHKRVKAKRVNCSSGGAQFFACFRAGTINLIVHPACELACPRQGASTVQPVNSLTRAAFLERAEDHDSGDDPTSPVVSCIGQVRMEKPGNKTPPRITTAAESAPYQRSLKSNRNRGKPAEDELTEEAVSRQPYKWKQILGTRGIVNPNPNPNQQTTRENTTTTTSIDESSSVEFFHIDLNRFSSAAAATQDTPMFGNHMKFGRPDRGELAAARGDASSLRFRAAEVSKDADADALECPPSPAAAREGATSEVAGVPLWQRRSGTCKPVSLVVKRRVLRSLT